MSFKKGDIIHWINENNKKSQAIIVQADWFNCGQPPSYIICLVSEKTYPELDFRPIINPDEINNFAGNVQIVVDKLITAKVSEIKEKSGQVSRKTMADINGCIRAILGI